MDMKVVLLVMLAITCVTAKPTPQDIKTLKLLKSLLEKLSANKPGNGSPNGDNGRPGHSPPNGQGNGPPNGQGHRPPNGQGHGPPNGQGHGPPNGQGQGNNGRPNGDGGDRPVEFQPERPDKVSYEDAQLLIKNLRVVMGRLDDSLTTQTEGMDKADVTDDIIFADAIGRITSQGRRLLDVDFKKLEMHLGLLVLRSSMYGFMDEPPCVSEDCMQQVSDAFEKADKDVKEQMETQRAECNTAKHNSLQDDRSENDDNKDDKDTDAILKDIHYGLENWNGANADIKKEIVDWFICFTGHVKNFTNELDPDTLPKDAGELHVYLLTNVLYTYEIAYELEEEIFYLDQITEFKQLKLITPQQLNGMYSDFADDMMKLGENFMNAIIATSDMKGGIFKMFDKLGDEILKIVFNFDKATKSLDETLHTADVLGFEWKPVGDPPCAKLLSLDTFDEFSSCVKEAAEEVKPGDETMKKTINETFVGIPECKAISDYVANLEGNKKESDPESQAVSDVIQINRLTHKKAGDLILTDLGCLGNVMSELLSDDSHYINLEMRPMLVWFDESFNLLEEVAERVFEDIESLYMVALNQHHQAAATKEYQQKAAATAKLLSQNVRSSLTKLKRSKFLAVQNEELMKLFKTSIQTGKAKE